MKHKLKGIIFDMDNTILRSKIDFSTMKKETYRFLVLREILPSDMDLSRHTTATVIEEAIRTNRMTDRLIQEVWDIPKKHEMWGMQGADLEPGTVEILNKLKGKYHITIVTNNSVRAAEIALRENNVMEYFDRIVGREMMDSLKPSPDGYLRILNEYKYSADEWVSVGDSWTDGKASINAGIKFIAYRSDIDKMQQMNVIPIAEITDLMELTNIMERIEEGLPFR
ncbi:HAD-IA family hydrolase [Paenibacillus sp. HJL G12]|uniref:HAD-IA family hydrolase n=1 Tax=Paenibacillus dendrobii TaxID=2691084 RepID=A0A7X3II31_9BACL|nr:HAD-IA family hydrolase [Paenibacillus dendrobii]MWV44319.1 HAD-IA family hydrolase [Paenibacillus dendrobii]